MVLMKYLNAYCRPALLLALMLSPVTLLKAESTLSATEFDQRASAELGFPRGNPPVGQRTLPPALQWGLENEPDEFEYQLWLDWFENNTERLGRTSFFNEPLMAGETQAMTIRYQSGVDLPEGSKIAVLAPWTSGIQFQISDPDGPNYVEIRSRNLELSFVATQVPTQVPFNSWYKGQVRTAFEVQGAAILAGEEIEFVLPNLQLPTEAGPLYLPVAFSLPDQSTLFTGQLIELIVQPNRTAKAFLSAPSRLGRNREGTLELQLQDRYGNLTEQSLPTFDLLLDGQFVQRVNPTTAVTQIAGISFSEPGTHTAEVRTGGGSLRGLSNPIVVQSGNRQVQWFDVSPGDQADEVRIRLARAD